MATFNKEIDVLRQIEKSREAIRRKHRLLKVGKESFEKAIDETFKPITDPLVKILNDSTTAAAAASEDSLQRKKIKPKHFKSFTEDYKSFNDTILNNTVKLNNETDLNNTFNTVYDDSENEANTTINDSLNKYLSLTKEKDIDNIFGVRKYGSELMIGDSPITFNATQVHVKDLLYPKTAGLLELLLKKDPNPGIISNADMNNYKEIIKATNAFKKNYKKDEGVNASRSKKYQKVIKPLLFSTPKKGDGLLPRNKVAKFNAQMDYVYWDDPNELVDRLRLLVAERSAGNLIHTNEIYSIIEELREAGIIY